MQALPGRLAIPIGMLLAATSLFVSTGRDDAYITYWSAYAVAHLGDFVNVNGDRVEQSSSLLLTLLLGGASRLLPIGIEVLGPAVSLLAGAALVALAAGAANRIRPGSALAAGLVAGSTPYLAYWSVSGMETTLASLTTLGAVLVMARYVDGGGGRAGVVAVVLAAASVRPEGGLVVAAAASALLAVLLGPARARSHLIGDVDVARARGRAVECLLFTAASIAALAAFRMAWFGFPVPQPVLAKVGGLPLGSGLDYLAQWGGRPYVLLPTLGFAYCVASLRRRSGSLAFLLAAALIAQIGFVVTSGGDWMEAGRFLVPAAGLLAVPLGGVLAGGGLHRWVLGALIAVQLAGVLHLAARDSTGRPLWQELRPPVAQQAAAALGFPTGANRVHARDALFVDVIVPALTRLRPALGRSVTVASGQAGYIPYRLASERTGDFEFIDLMSLTMREFSSCPEGLFRSQYGRVMRMAYWIDHEETCGVDLPDLLFGLGFYDALPPKVRGRYALVKQIDVGRIRSSGWPEGRPLNSAQFLAVRADLARLLASTP